ncbi:MAG: hypothetical protein IT584_01130 [Chlamydiae bacterium]|nr:hypothetical protein [Chlamydiota bacterium]
MFVFNNKNKVIMSFEVSSIGVVSTNPAKRAFSDKLVENSKKMTFALNVILLLGALASIFLGPVGLILTAAIYGGATFATNGSFQLAIGNMRNSKTEMSLAWQTHNHVSDKTRSIDEFKAWLNHQEDKEATVRGFMVSFWSLDERTQQKIQNLADVSESERAAYENSSDAKADQETATFLLSDDGRADGILPSREELNNEIQRQEERNMAMKMEIAWQVWRKDSSLSKTSGASFESFEKWLNQFDPKEKEVRLERFVLEFR